MLLRLIATVNHKLCTHQYSAAGQVEFAILKTSAQQSEKLDANQEAS